MRGTHRAESIEVASPVVEGIAVASRRVPLAVALAARQVQSGEIVQMTLKPSLWWMVLSCRWFVGLTVLALMTVLVVRNAAGAEAGILAQWALFVIGGRVMWAVLQWMGRLYVITDRRLLCISGVFQSRCDDVELRRVDRLRSWQSIGERLTRTATIEIAQTHGQSAPSRTVVWQTVARPAEVEKVIRAAVMRAQ